MLSRRSSKWMVSLLCYWCATTAPVSAAPATQPAEARPLTYCNPLDLSYRFALKTFSLSHGRSSREGADPTMVVHDGQYWLFVSKSGGYWHSTDMVHWDFVEPAADFPSEDYAPTVQIVGNKWVLTASGGRAIYTSDDPATGRWTKLRTIPSYYDPDLFLDDDGRLYLYYGSSPNSPIRGIELDVNNNFAAMGESKPLIPIADGQRYGWENMNLAASDEQISKAPLRPWREGAWMNKHNGTYYLQYAAPATQMRGYGDGVYVSDKPLGEFHYVPYNPFSYKPTGFIGSAGHGSTYQDVNGRFWHAATMLVGVGYFFDRRVGIFPAGFVPDGNAPDQLVCNTYLGDYPQLAPGLAKDPLSDNTAGWMLVSLKKKATASSVLDQHHTPDLAFDEDVSTAWAAASDHPGEWLAVDLGKPCRIDAIQFNFGDIHSTAYDRLRNDTYQYTLEVSDDAAHWRACVDKRDNPRDAPHEYLQLERPVFARYARLTNYHTPAGAVFSVSGLRLFGSGLGQPPQQVTGSNAQRHTNRRLMNVAWNPAASADFYIVRYGTRPDRLTFNYQVYGGNKVTIPGLNSDVDYFFTVDAINDSGVTRSNQVERVWADNPSR